MPPIQLTAPAKIDDIYVTRLMVKWREERGIKPRN